MTPNGRTPAMRMPWPLRFLRRETQSVRPYVRSGSISSGTAAESNPAYAVQAKATRSCERLPQWWNGTKKAPSPGGVSGLGAGGAVDSEVPAQL
jgi:hypothetical protein